MRFKKFYPEAATPTRATDGAAGYDLAALGDITIKPGHTDMVTTGIAAEIPHGQVGLLFVRSSVGWQGLSLPNAVGVIDSDYRGQIFIPLHNRKDRPLTIRHHERIAQLVVLPCGTSDVELVDNLTDTQRGEDGFGSTGE
ncbi:hypothetical protein CPHO_08415 [Corynebacterium phocae]|uniref:dUTP diphosphatase n=1 Tax=Corynebacterium phocae TaxID=161895 RepID=A0A1L7D413_9CORY|nr:dUTP diphosphatase [Corynebacterium phocae]APT92906.1 hypothetical protein CPHO_08415 [Corynebacterium phocae]KAA8723230.1 dUTP diphosphatase [Corynebacterium phocae]